MTPTHSSARLPQLQETSFSFKKPDLLKDAMQGQKQGFLKRMSNSHKIRDFTEPTQQQAPKMGKREYTRLQEFFDFYSSSDSDYAENDEHNDTFREKTSFKGSDIMRLMKDYNAQRIRKEDVLLQAEESIDTSREGESNRVGAGGKRHILRKEQVGLRGRLQAEMREGFGIDVERLINSMRDLKRDSQAKGGVHQGRAQWKDEGEQSFESELEVEASSDESSAHESDLLKDMRDDESNSQVQVESDGEQEKEKLEKALEKSQHMVAESRGMRFEDIKNKLGDTLRVGLMAQKEDNIQRIKRQIVQKFNYAADDEGAKRRFREEDVTKVRKNYMAYKHQLLFFQKYFLRWKASKRSDSRCPRAEAPGRGSGDGGVRGDAREEGAEDGAASGRAQLQAQRRVQDLLEQHALPHAQARPLRQAVDPLPRQHLPPAAPQGRVTPIKLLQSPSLSATLRGTSSTGLLRTARRRERPPRQDEWRQTAIPEQ